MSEILGALGLLAGGRVRLHAESPAPTEVPCTGCDFPSPAHGWVSWMAAGAM